MSECITVIVQRTILEGFDDVGGCISRAATPNLSTLDELLSRGWCNPETKTYCRLPPYIGSPVEVIAVWKKFVDEVYALDVNGCLASFNQNFKYLTFPFKSGRKNA